MRGFAALRGAAAPLCVAAAALVTVNPQPHVRVLSRVALAQGVTYHQRDGSSARISLLAETDLDGKTTAAVTVCAPACERFALTAPTLEEVEPGRVIVRGESAAGPVDLVLGSNAANALNYECVDGDSSYAVEGTDVEPSYFVGAVGNWDLETTGCAVAARNAVIEKVSLA